MGYQHDSPRVGPIDERDVELVVGRRPQKSISRKVVRCALAIAVSLAVVLLHASRGGLSSRHRPVELMLDGNGHSPWIEPTERGELIKCFREGASEATHREDPDDDDYDNDHKQHELTFVTLPKFTLDGESLYFFADPPPQGGRCEHRGATYGEVTFSVSNETDEVSVQAKIGYRRRIVSDVCTFKRNDGAVGVGVVIFHRSPDTEDNDDGDDEDGHDDPDHPSHCPPDDDSDHYHENNRVKLVVHFPASKSPLHLKGLETRLPLYGHALGVLGESVQIDALDLKSANAAIKAEAVNAKTVEVKTVNSIISGSFNATNSLTLTTANAPIDVKIGFVSSLKKDDGPATLTLGTANARLRAAIDLSTSDADFAGDFLVKTRTEDAPLNVKILSLLYGGKLGFSGKTVNAPADVVLPTSYEGSFRLSTVVFKTELVVREGVADPAGRGRQRTVDVHNMQPLSRTPVKGCHALQRVAVKRIHNEETVA